MELTASTRWSDTAPLSPGDKILLEEHNNRPVPHVALRGARFLAAVLVGAGAVVGILVAIGTTGLALERGVEDALGSSTNASARVSLYQTVNGFVWAGVTLLLEQYFRVFLAVLVVFFGNAKWHPRDTPRDGELPKYKRLALLALPPLAMYVVNLGLTSVFIEHKPTGVRRAFVDQDLVRVTTLSRTTSLDGKTTELALTRDTVLRAAVTGQVVPFTLKESISCRSGATTVTAENCEHILGSTALTATIQEPSIVEIEATSVAYAFPMRDWYEQALPQALKPTHTITFTARDVMGAGDAAAADAKRFKAFLQDTGINLTTIHELLVQGLTSFGKAASSSNAYLDYPCDVIDHKGNEVNEPQGVELYGPDSNFTGRRRCYGAAGVMRPDIDLSNSSNHDLRTIMTLANFARFEDWNDTMLRIDKIVVSPSINLTALTIDLPFTNTTDYRLNVDKSKCDESGVFNATRLDEEETKASYTAEDWAQYEAEVCDPRYISYANSSRHCGASNCVFKEESSVIAVKKQFTMAPYMTNCNMSDITYNVDQYAWFPNGCKPHPDAALLFGLGSYITGDFYPSRSSVRNRTAPPVPAIAHARRHYVMSMAKMEWQFEDVSKRFGATCGVEGGKCDGILHALNKSPSSVPTAVDAVDNKANVDNKAKVLVVGRNHFKSDLRNYSMVNPIVLLSLNTPQFYYRDNDPANLTYYFWERIDLAMMNTTYSESTGLGLANDQFSMLVDAYLQQQDANHYFIQDPLHPLYASALFYLFQDATVKEVELPATNTKGVVDLANDHVIGVTHMTGDVEKKEIRYSISLVSAVATSLGVIFMLLYLAMMLQWPRDAVNMSDEHHFPAQYAQVLMNDRYPRSLHKRRLKLPNDDIVEMDDYVVANIVFHHPLEPDQKVLL